MVSRPILQPLKWVKTVSTRRVPLRLRALVNAGGWLHRACTLVARCPLTIEAPMANLQLMTDTPPRAQGREVSVSENLS